MGIGMMFHFQKLETGLVAGDLEACIKGTWLDEESNPHTFFGCDDITVK
jgi:hypothetical protein